MTSTKPTVAFLGATGGTTNAALVQTLLGGHHAIALARTPSKLRTQLESKGLPASVLDNQLTIIAGNALSTSSLKQLFTADNTPNHLVTHIVNGLGGAPSMVWNWSNPLQCVKLDNPHICEDAAKATLTTLSEIYRDHPDLRARKPHLVFVSTTGISRGPEDVPFGMQFFYHQTLHQPHADKKVTEDVYRDNIDGKDERGPVLASIICVRPTLLTGDGSQGTAVGLDKIRVGTEDKPARGFTISRADVGHWIYENGVKDLEVRKPWANQMVSLTA